MAQTPTTPSSPAPPRRASWLHMYGPALWAGAVLLGAVYYYYLSTQIAFSTRPGRLGPSFWPQAILILLIITAAVDCFVEARKAPARAAAYVARAEESGGKRVWWLMALGLVAILAYVNLASLVGFPLANALFMLAFMMLGGFKRPIPAALISLIGTVVLVLLFVRIVYVSLPLGLGPFQNLTLWIYYLLGIV